MCRVTAVFQCTATGALPLTFTWWRNITNYSFMGRWIYSWWWETEQTVTEKVNSNDTCFIQMVNDSTSQLSFSNTSMPVFEEYFCEVSDTYGQSNRSEPALLLVYKGKIDNHTWYPCHLTFIQIIYLKYSLWYSPVEISCQLLTLGYQLVPWVCIHDQCNNTEPEKGNQFIREHFSYICIH